MSSDLNSLHPYVKKLAEAFLEECKKQNFPVKIYQTYRSVQEQNKLYAQGRTIKGNKVTNARGGYSYHNYGLAFDAAPIVNGEINWDNEKLFETMGSIGKSVGLEWGGSWKTFKDTPHFQWSGGLSIKQLLAGQRPTIPTSSTISVDENKLPTINQVELLKINDIKVFQSKMGLASDGIVGKKTKAIMDEILKMPSIKKGYKGNAVRYLQYRLNISTDGIFGIKTETALKNWQLLNNIEQTGICDEKEWDILI